MKFNLFNYIFEKRTSDMPIRDNSMTQNCKRNHCSHKNERVREWMNSPPALRNTDRRVSKAKMSSYSFQSYIRDSRVAMVKRKE